MSFNSPFSNPEENNKPSHDMTPAASAQPEFNYADVPSYGTSPDVPPTGKTSTLTIVSFVLAIIFPLIGFILSIVAWRQAAETGDNRGLAKAGIIVGAVLTVLNVVLTFVLMGSITNATVNGSLH
jgi:hypothetical protein